MLKGCRLNFQIPRNPDFFISRFQADFILLFVLGMSYDVKYSGHLNATPFSEFCLCILYIFYALSIKNVCSYMRLQRISYVRYLVVYSRQTI